MTTTIDPEKLTLLDELTLKSGSHSNFEDGACAMEVVSWLADEGFTDAPTCASPVLRRYVISLNDRWDNEKRQELKPYLIRMIGTGNDGKDDLREKIATNALLTDLLAPWFRLAGMTKETDEMAGLVDATVVEQREAIRRWRDAAWNVRTERVTSLRATVEKTFLAKLKERSGAAGAAEAAWAAGKPDFSYGTDAYWKVRSAAYTAAKKYYDENPPAIATEIAELAATQSEFALTLLDRLITADA